MTQMGYLGQTRMFWLQDQMHSIFEKSLAHRTGCHRRGSTVNAKPVCHPGLSDSTRVGTSFFVFLELHFCSSTAIAELVSGELLGATGLDQTKHPA